MRTDTATGLFPPDIYRVPRMLQRCGLSLRALATRQAWAYIVRCTHVAKRLLDVILSAVLLVLLMPLGVLVALAIKADGGPILHWQMRVGRWGKPFAFPKFRSMRMDADQVRDSLAAANHHTNGITFKMKNDPRITAVGRVIRKTSIDELPQLWCVLKGDMSLVGPRPPLPREVALYTLADRRRLEVTPGLTCIWQVSGRADIDFPRQVELDVDYIESQSLKLDFMLLFRTVEAVFSGRGAY